MLQSYHVHCVRGRLRFTSFDLRDEPRIDDCRTQQVPLLTVMMRKKHNVTAKPPFYWVRVLWLTNKKNHWKRVNRSWTKCQGNRCASCIVWNQNLLDTGKFVRRSSLSTQWERFPDLFEGSKLRVKDKKYRTSYLTYCEAKL